MGNETDQDVEARRRQLMEARDTVDRQLDMLESGCPVYGARNRDVQVGGLVEQLRDTLRELDACIAELPPTSLP